MAKIVGIVLLGLVVIGAGAGATVFGVRQYRMNPHDWTWEAGDCSDAVSSSFHQDAPDHPLLAPAGINFNLLSSRTAHIVVHNNESKVLTVHGAAYWKRRSWDDEITEVSMSFTVTAPARSTSTWPVVITDSAVDGQGGVTVLHGDKTMDHLFTESPEDIDDTCSIGDVGARFAPAS